MNSIKHINCFGIERPLRTTFSTSLGKKDTIKSIIVRVTLKDGTEGIGECPTSFTLKEETIPAIKGVIREVAPRLIDVTIDDYGNILQDIRKKYTSHPMTISGLEVALFRARLKEKGISEQVYWGNAANQIETDITIPCNTNSDVSRKWVSYATGKGFSIFKLKVSGHIEDDMRFISLVQEELKRKAKEFSLRIDCNQGYTIKTFLKFIQLLKKSNYNNIQLIEQPLPRDDYEGMKEIKRHSILPVILDETIITSDDMHRVAGEDLCDGVNIKIAKSGISESAKIYEIAKKNGLKLMIGCMTETMTGLSAGISFAAGTGGFDYIDLDSIYFLHHRNHYNEISIDGPAFKII